MTDDEAIFRQAMLGEGVRRIDAPKSVARQRPAAPAPPTPVPAPRAAPAPVVVHPTRVDTDALIAAAEARTQAAEARAVAAESELKEARQREHIASERSGLTEARATAAEAEIKTLLQARTEADSTQIRLAEQIAKLGEVPPTRRLDKVLLDLGHANPSRTFAEIIRALHLQERADELLRRLCVDESSELRHWLSDKVLLLCKACTGAAPANVLLVDVEGPRCELCGGSAVKGAATHFISACRRAGKRRVLVVGGSPAYDPVVRDLLDGSVDLRQFRGDSRTDRNRGGPQLAWADLVIVWVPTVLDHSISDQFKGPKVLRIPFRGIAAMLNAAAAEIAPER